MARIRAENARSRLAEITAALPLLVRNRLLTASSMLDSASRAIEAAGQRRISSEQMRLTNVYAVLKRDLEVAVNRETLRLNALADKVSLLSPQNVLARGYSITLVDGKAVRNAADIAPGTRIVSRLQSGEITSITE